MAHDPRLTTATVPLSWLISTVQLVQIAKGFSDEEALKQARERVSFMEGLALQANAARPGAQPRPDNADLSCPAATTTDVATQEHSA